MEDKISVKIKSVSGINLSQSIQGKQAQAQVKFFDRGLIIGVVILVLLVIITVASRWYVGALEKKMIELDTLITQKKTALKGQSIDRLVDFSDRMSTIGDHIQSEPNPADILGLIEENTLASVRLTNFRYNRTNHQVLVEGVARSLKEIAQQMLVFKRVDVIESVRVESIVYDESGTIKFSLVVQEKTVNSTNP